MISSFFLRLNRLAFFMMLLIISSFSYGQTITPQPSLWYSAQINASSPNYSLVSGLVSQWNNKGSLLSKDIIQSNALLRPARTLSAINTRPAISFSSSTANSLIIPGLATGTTATVSTKGSFNLVIQTGDVSSSTPQMIYSKGNSATTVSIYIRSGQLVVLQQVQGSFWINYAIAPVASNTNYVITALCNSSAKLLELYVNGALAGSRLDGGSGTVTFPANQTSDFGAVTNQSVVQTSGAYTSLTGTITAPTNYFKGMIGEFMYHDEKLLTTTERKTIENYLFTTYGFVNNLTNNTNTFLTPYSCAGCLETSHRTIAWLKADAITGLANGADVNLDLKDVSGNNYNTYNPTTPRPIYTTSAINGKPALTFYKSSNPTDRRSLGLPVSNLLTAAGNLNVERSYALVINTGADIINRQVIYKEGDNTKGIIVYIYNNQLYAYMYTGSGFNYSYSTAITAGQNVVIHMEKGSNSWQVYFNGNYPGYSYVPNALIHTSTSTVSIGAADETSTKFADSPTPATPPDASNFSFKGYLAELVIWDRYNNQTERRIIENHLALKYGIQTVNDNYRWQETNTFELGAIGTELAGNYYNTSSCSNILRFSEDNTSDKKLALIAHDNATNIPYFYGYISSSTNSPKNVVRMLRTWRSDIISFPSLEAGGSKVIDFYIKSGELTPSTLQKAVLIVDSDGDFTKGSRLYAFSAGTVNGISVKQANDILINAGDYISLGLLHISDIGGSYLSLNAMGKTDGGYEDNDAVLEGLTLTAASPAVGNYIVMGVAITGAPNLTNTPVPPGTTGASTNRIWKLNHYGNMGPLEVQFDPTVYLPSYTVNPANDFVLMIDPTGAGSFTASSQYVNFVYEGGKYRAFGVVLPNNAAFAIAAVAKASPTETTQYKKILKESLGEISTPTPIRLLGKSIQPYEYTTPCARTVDKASLYITLNTGDDYLLGTDVASSGGIAFSASVIAMISSRRVPGGAYTNIQPCTLIVSNNKPEQILIQDMSSEYATYGLRDFKVSVISSNLPTNITIKNSLQFQVELVEESRTAVTITAVSPIINQVAQDVAINTGVYQFTWDSEFCDAPLYQFQLLRLYNTVDYVPVSANDRDMRSADVDWSKALTLETTTKNIQLTLTEGTGYYVWRVRPVGTFYSGGTANDQNWGVWSTPPGLAVPLTILNGADLTPYKGMIFYYDQFDRDKNFIYNRVFTEEGKIHEGISYANGLQQSLQTQSRVPSNGSTGQVVVTETVYDYSGRPALQSMGAPDIATGSNYLGFRSMVISKDSEPYTAYNFDRDANFSTTDPLNEINPLDNGLINLYYSDNNATEPLVPNAEAYPYSRVLYDNDGLNRVKEQGAPGPKHTTGSGHTVRITYSAVTDAELIRVFGDEAPKSSSVSKTVTTDQNNISTVSYTDMTGKVIATCLIKNTLSTNLLPINGPAEPGFTIIEKLNNNTALPDNGISAVKPFVFTEPTTIHVEFKLTPAFVPSICGDSYCHTCAYKAVIRVRNVETDVVTEEEIKIEGGVCPSSPDEPITKILNVPVTAGKYTVEKIIKIDDSGAIVYAKKVIENDSTAIKNFVDSNILTYVEDPENIDIEGLNTNMAALLAAPPAGYTITVQRAANVTFALPLIDGDKVTIATACCALTIPIMIPDVPPCKALHSNRDNAFAIAEIFAAQYEQAKGTSWTWDMPSKVGSYARDDFKYLITNMLNELDGTGNFVYTCDQLWNCWNGQIVKNLSGGLSNADVHPNQTTPEQKSKNQDGQPEWAGTDIAAQTDGNGGKPDIEQFLDCAGYHYKGYLKDATTDAYRLKTEAFKLFLYNRPTNPSTGQILCENTFCKITATGSQVSPCNLVMCPRREATVSTYTGLEFLTAITPDTYTLLTESEYFSLHQCLTTQQYDILNAPGGANVPTYANMRADVLARKKIMENDCNGACDGKRDKFISKLEALYPKDLSGIRRNEQGQEVEYANICCTADKLIDYCKDQCYLSLNQVRCDDSGINAGDPVKIVSLGTVEEINAVMAILYGDFELEDASTTTVACSTDYSTVEMCYQAIGIYHLGTSTDVDGSPNLKNATVSGSILTGGRTSTSKYINGSSAYATCSSDDSRGIINNVTVSAWVKKSSSSTGTQIIVDKMGSTQGFILYLVNDFLYFDVKDNGTLISSGPSIFPMASTTYDPAKWHFVTGVCRDNSVEVWVDGEFSAGFNLPSPTTISDIGSTNTTSLKIGASSGGFTGLIDEVYVYACAMGKGALQEQYEITSGIDLNYIPEPSNSLGCGAPVLGTAPSRLWDRSGGYWTGIYGTKKLSNGKAYTYGFYSVTQANTYIYPSLVILDQDGNKQEKTYQDHNLGTFVDLIELGSGNIALAGYKTTSSPYAATCIVNKVNTLGEVIWSWTTPLNVPSIEVTVDGGRGCFIKMVELNGMIHVIVPENSGLKIYRLYSNGVLKDVVTYSWLTNYNFNVYGMDNLNSFKSNNTADLSGNYLYFVGYPNKLAKIDLSKINAANPVLSFVWEKVFSDYELHSIHTIDNGTRCMLLGDAGISSSVKLGVKCISSDLGTLIWEKSWLPTTVSAARFNYSKIVSNGRIAVCGYYANTGNWEGANSGYMCLIEGSGNINSYLYDATTKSYYYNTSIMDLTDPFFTLIESSAGGYYVFGKKGIISQSDQLIVKLDANLQFEWEKRIPTKSFNYQTSKYNLIEFNNKSIMLSETYWESPYGGAINTERTAVTDVNCGNQTYCFDNWYYCLGYSSACTRQPLCIKWKSTPATITVYDPELPPSDQPAQIATIIKNLVKDQMDGCINTNLNVLYQHYRNSCKTKITDETTVSYSLTNEQYTLYYYDRAGNLVKTVPPAGVETLDVSDPTSNTMKRKEQTAHRLITTYKYNSLGQLVEQYTPDAKTTQFVYNKLGMLRFSQNAKQVVDQTYSYTKYDELGRIIEVGQATEAATVLFATLNDPVHGSPYLDGGLAPAVGATSYPNTTTGLSQQIYTVYNTPALQYNYLGTAQRYLRNRISYTFTKSLKNDKSVTAYSYDPHGNVEWIVQDVPGFSKNTIAYDYDLISNKVIKVKYNEKRIDQFFHRYTYDADNKVTSLFTSRDGYLWDNDVRYQYYKYGRLKRQEIGEDKIQGLDYTYTIQGWLKAVNEPGLSSTEDPGHDTQSGNGYTPDEFGFALGYYKGDFNRNGSPFNETSLNTLKNADNELFNGNISTWVTQINAQHLSAPTGQRFKYDYLNRLLESNYTTSPSPTTSTYLDDYKTTYEYDRNGNITHLTRNTAAGTRMDDLSYNYYNKISNKLMESNRLSSVSEDPLIGPAVSSNDIDNTQGVNNYVYDNIGNLTDDASENTKVRWTVYGKVDEVKRITPNVANKEAETRFIYDANGNRIAKEVNLHPYSSGGVYQRLPENLTTTYYVRDASGNIMATYGRYNVANATAGYYDAIFYLQDQPLYGSSRVGQYNTNSQTAVPLGSKRFQTSEMDIVQLDFNFVTKKSEYTNWITPIASTDPVGATTSVIPSIKLNSITTSGSTLTTAVIPKIQKFCGVVGNDVSIAEDDNGIILFYTVSMKSFWGKPDVLLLFDVDGTLMRSSGGIKAGSGSRNVIVRMPGETKKYFLITRGPDKKLYSHTIDLTQAGNGTALAPKGDVTSVNNVLDSKLYGSHLVALEDRATDKSYIYATTSTTPALPSIELGTLNVVVFEVSALGPKAIKAPQVMCQSLVSRQDIGESELKISPDAKKIAVYNHLQNAGWFGLQKSEVLIFNLGANYKVGTNYAAEMVSVPAGWSLPRQSLEFNNDSRFIYFGSDHLTLTTSSSFSTPTAKEFSRYDIRDNVVVKETFFKGIDGNILRSKIPRIHVQDRMATSTSPLGVLRTYIEDVVTAATLIGTNLNFSLAANATNTGLLPLQNHIRFSIPATTSLVSREINKKAYELSDHLGNVSVVLSDMKTADWSGTGTLNGNTATMISYSNYYPFGMLTNQVYTPDVYRYGYNGKEKDVEGIAGGGTTYDYGFRIYNPQIAKFLSVDPLTRSYPWYTPYQFAGNKPIWAIDLDGKEELYNWLKQKAETGVTELKKIKDATVKSASEGLSATGNFFGGVANSVASNNSFGLVPKDRGTKAFKLGQDVGDKISLAQGAAEMAGGIVLDVGGGVVEVFSLGTATPIVVPVEIFGTASMVHGFSLTGYMLNSQGNEGSYSHPDSQEPLPRNEDGTPAPDADATGPHTQLGKKQGSNGDYNQAREFDADGKPVKDVDFTDHGRPGNHTNPHEHQYKPNESGGTPQRGKAQPLTN